MNTEQGGIFSGMSGMPVRQGGVFSGMGESYVPDDFGVDLFAPSFDEEEASTLQVTPETPAAAAAAGAGNGLRNLLILGGLAAGAYVALHFFGGSRSTRPNRRR